MIIALTIVNPWTINHVTYRLGTIDISNTKHVKKKIDEELTPVTWHPTRVWDWCISQNEKKEVESFLADET